MTIKRSVFQIYQMHQKNGLKFDQLNELDQFRFRRVKIISYKIVEQKSKFWIVEEDFSGHFGSIKIKHIAIHLI